MEKNKQTFKKVAKHNNQNVRENKRQMNFALF